MKWLKNGAKKGFIFHAIIKKKNRNQNVKVDKMVVFVKAFDYYYLMFNLGNFSSCPVKL